VFVVDAIGQRNKTANEILSTEKVEFISQVCEREGGREGVREGVCVRESVRGRACERGGRVLCVCVCVGGCVCVCVCVCVSIDLY